MKYPVVIFSLLLSTSVSHGAEELSKASLHKFVTDYCTYFPEGTPNKPNLWKDCCISHDLSYWVGGDKEDQDEADLRLKKCVTGKAGNFYGSLMYRGVRMGHYSPIKNKYRWSWGWQIKDRVFQSLTDEEKTLVKQIVRKSKIKPSLIDKFIEELSTKTLK